MASRVCVWAVLTEDFIMDALCPLPVAKEANLLSLQNGGQSSIIDAGNKIHHFIEDSRSISRIGLSLVLSLITSVQS